jgi:RNA polymerase sigma factor (sigma-70 family)
MSDAELVDEQLRLLMRAAQDGDGNAYRALLSAITPRIRRIIRARRSFLGAEDVEDLVQDVLLSVHAVRATYDPVRPFMPWLFAIVRHRLADAARRYGRQHEREVLVADFDVTFQAAAANTEEEGEGDREALALAIEALPAGQRQAIELLKLKEMSLKEAASETGLSIAALKVATHRAMLSLRRVLHPGDHHED